MISDKVIKDLGFIPSMKDWLKMIKKSPIAKNDKDIEFLERETAGLRDDIRVLRKSQLKRMSAY